MLQPVTEADGAKFRFRPREGIAAPGEFKRHGNIFKRRHGRNEVERLEDDTYMLAAEPREPVLVLPRKIFACHSYPACARPLKARQHHEERRLARPGRTDETGRAAARDLEIDPAQYVDQSGRTRQAQLQTFKLDDGIAQLTARFSLPNLARAFGRYGMFAAIFKQAPAAMLCLLLSFPALAAERPLTIVALGDSLTAGYLLGPDDGFVPQLEKALKAKGYHNLVIVNGGVSGDTSSGGLSRLDWTVGPEADAVIVELGANDALRGIDPKLTRRNLAEILQRLSGRHLPVLLAGMIAPPNMGAAYGKSFNAIYPELAAGNHLVFYPFFLDGVAGELNGKPVAADLTLADGMHPNAEGVAIIVARILPKVETLIAEAQKAREKRAQK